MADHTVESRGPSGSIELLYHHTESGGMGYVDEYACRKLGIENDRVVLAIEDTFHRVTSEPRVTTQKFSLTVQELIELFQKFGVRSS